MAPSKSFFFLLSEYFFRATMGDTELNGMMEMPVEADRPYTKMLTNNFYLTYQSFF